MLSQVAYISSGSTRLRRVLSVVDDWCRNPRAWSVTVICAGLMKTSVVFDGRALIEVVSRGSRMSRRAVPACCRDERRAAGPRRSRLTSGRYVVRRLLHAGQVTLSARVEFGDQAFHGFAGVERAYQIDFDFLGRGVGGFRSSAGSAVASAVVLGLFVAAQFLLAFLSRPSTRLRTMSRTAVRFATFHNNLQKQ